MGHSKIQTTFDVYGHLFPGSHDEVRARMDAYLAAGDVLTGAPTGAPARIEAEVITPDPEEIA
jgi:hypothetical protein